MTDLFGSIQIELLMTGNIKKYNIMFHFSNQNFVGILCPALSAIQQSQTLFSTSSDGCWPVLTFLSRMMAILVEWSICEREGWVKGDLTQRLGLARYTTSLSQMSTPPQPNFCCGLFNPAGGPMHFCCKFLWSVPLLVLSFAIVRVRNWYARPPWKAGGWACFNGMVTV